MNLRLLLIITLAALIGTCSSPPSILDQVLDTGELRVVTRDSPTSYTISPDGPTGPEFDLVQAFADDLGVALVIEPVISVAEILPKLLSGDAHMAAAGLSMAVSAISWCTRQRPCALPRDGLGRSPGQSHPASRTATAREKWLYGVEFHQPI